MYEPADGGIVRRALVGWDSQAISVDCQTPSEMGKSPRAKAPEIPAELTPRPCWNCTAPIIGAPLTVTGGMIRHFATSLFFSEDALASFFVSRNDTFDWSSPNRLMPTFLIIASGIFLSGVVAGMMRLLVGIVSFAL